MRLRLVLPPALWLLLAVATVAPAAGDLPALDKPWQHYRSPNFELYSTATERESRSLLHNLELLRAVFFDRFRLVERTRLELTAYLFDDRKDFIGYGPPGMSPQSGLGAFYLAHPDRAIISIGPTPNAPAPIYAGPFEFTVFTTSAQHLIFHEYVHHLFRATNQHPTLWFGEGVAEMLATIQVHRDRIELGHANAPTLLLLQNNPLLPFAQVFSATPASAVYRRHNFQGMFYAQSWALLHYLHFGESGLPRAGIERFVRVMGDRKLAATLDTAEFFRECFGFDYAEMQRRLDRYVGNGKYRARTQPLPQIPSDKTYQARSVPAAEARLRLAELALRVQRSPLGKLALLDATEARDPRVHEALGTAALQDEDADRAREFWERALELGSTNGAVLREFALLESRRWLQHFDFDLRLPAETTATLRQRLLASIKQEPAQSAAYEMLVWLEAFSAEPVVENVNLVQQHFRQLAEKPRTLVALAMVRVRLQRPAEAQALLAELSQLPPDPHAKKIAAAIRERLTPAQ